MELLLTYLAKSAGLLIVFFALYHFLLRQDHSFSTNRKFLLGGLFASAILPSVQFTRTVFIEAQKSTFQIIEGDFPVSEVVPQEPVITPMQILLVIYLTGVAFMTGRMLLQLFSLSKILFSGKLTKTGRINYISVSGKIVPFSFLNFIVYNPALHSDTELLHILKHEKAHVIQWHTADVLLANINLIYQWFNPFAWLYVKILQQNLEYIADSEAIKEVPCKKEYQKALVKISVGDFNPALTNSFYQSFIKKRIVMLNRNTKTKNNFWKVSLAFPFMLGFIFLFNIKTEAQIKPAQENKEQPISGNQEITGTITMNSTEENLSDLKKVFANQDVTLDYETIERSPEGVITAITVRLLNKNTNSSGIVNKNNTVGINAFEMFVEDGTLGFKDVTPESAKGNSSMKEVKNISGSTSKSRNTGVNEIHADTINPVSVKGIPGNPVFFVDGKEVSGRTVESMNPSNINSISVLKGASAVSVYGKKAEDGAVIIETKKDTVDTYRASSARMAITNGSGSNDSTGKNINKLYVNPGITFNKNSIYNINSDSININASQWGTRTSPVKTSFFTIDQDLLYVVDGKEMPKDFDRKSIDPQNIASMRVLKDEASIKKYGEKAADGVIEITTKNAENKLQENQATFAVLKAKTTDEALRSIKNELKKQADLEVTFSNLKRNREGLITAVKVSGKKGNQEVIGTFNETNKIPDIYIGVHTGTISISSTPPEPKK